MTKPKRVKLDLSPETIAAVTAAVIEALRSTARPAPTAKPEPAPPPYSRPPPKAAQPLDVASALDGREHVTIPQLLTFMGIPRETWTHRLTIRAGVALARAGWGVASRLGSGGRERVYRPLDKPRGTT